jgi:hypothetical protein
MQSHGQPTPLDIVKLYIRHTSNEGDADWIPRLCANPVRRHDPDSVTEMTHAEQMERIRASSMRALGPQFHTVVLHGEGPFVTWIWQMTLQKGDKRLCGIEVFKIENGLITDMWNAPYAHGAWV